MFYFANRKKSTNDEFLKLFARKNDVIKPHYYQFCNCYELLTSRPKWNFAHAKKLKRFKPKTKGRINYQIIILLWFRRFIRQRYKIMEMKMTWMYLLKDPMEIVDEL